MTTQELICSICHQPWVRELARGRVPTKCPGCKDVQPSRALPAREQLALPVDPPPSPKRSSVLDRVLSPAKPVIPDNETPYRVRMGSNLFLPGSYTLTHAHQVAQARAKAELPPSEGGATYYVVREEIAGAYHA